MRIIAGEFKRRSLKTLKGSNTRPMMDRMKEAVFNSIGPYFDDVKVLDLFGGSGALSLESISRGATRAYVIDKAKDATKVINENINLLNVGDKAFAFNMSYERALRKFKDEKFDLIFLDPPYKLNIINDIAKILIDNKMLAENAYLVCHYVKGNLEEIDGLKLIKNFAYGSSEVSIYQN